MRAGRGRSVRGMISSVTVVDPGMASTGNFHEGELAVQSRAGVGAEAARLSRMLASPHLDGSIGGFLAGRDFVVITARDESQRLWTSALWGTPGFLDAHAGTLTIGSAPAATDPLAGLTSGQPVGLIAIEFATRRRVRVNGTLTHVQPGRLDVEVDQAFGNCPKYIQQRSLTDMPTAESHPATAAQRGRLGPTDAALIRGADTFFLGTSHPERGADASHRGGTPGFVRVDGADLWWPDYPGNNMFNSLGNLAVDDAAAALFIDFVTGAALHLSGTAAVAWTAPGAAGDDGGTGRRVRMHVTAVANSTMPVHAGGFVASPHNPPLT